mmetsp:Transcript_87074/g.281096  ORF Transcript_87074/g.281096 Transcript_87074/m.281096 type:complete len:263 (+) Transcript_87074:681-1469(+)
MVCVPEMLAARMLMLQLGHLRLLRPPAPLQHAQRERGEVKPAPELVVNLPAVSQRADQGHVRDSLARSRLQPRLQHLRQHRCVEGWSLPAIPQRLQHRAEHLQASRYGAPGSVPSGDAGGEVHEGESRLMPGGTAHQPQLVDDVTPRGLFVPNQLLEVPVCIALEQLVVGVALAPRELAQRCAYRQALADARLLHGNLVAGTGEKVHDVVLVDLEERDIDLKLIPVMAGAKLGEQSGYAPGDEPTIGEALYAACHGEGLSTP